MNVADHIAAGIDGEPLIRSSLWFTIVDNVVKINRIKSCPGLRVDLVQTVTTKSIDECYGVGFRLGLVVSC